MDNQKISLPPPSPTAYDDAFRTMLNDCAGLIIPVVNLYFNENYIGNEEIIFSKIILTTTAKGIVDDVQHQRILSRICCAASSRSAARAFGGRDGQNYSFVAGKEVCLSKFNGRKVCTWRLNGNSW